MIVTRFALPVRSPIPLIVPCTCVAPASTAVERVGDAAAGVVVRVDPQRRAGQRFGDDRERRADLRRQRAAVGVAQHQTLGARLGGGAQAVQRVARIEREAVEEVLGVEQHPLALRRRGSATESAIIARFSSRETRTTFSTCSTEALPTSVQTGAKHSASDAQALRPRSAAVSRRRVIPKATISALASRSPASSPNSSCSFGFEAGKPASIRSTPSSSRAWTTRSFSAAVSDMPPPPMPSRRVASYSSMRWGRCSSGDSFQLRRRAAGRDATGRGHAA